MKLLPTLAWLLFALIAWAPVLPLAMDALALPGAVRQAAVRTMASRWEVFAATITLAGLTACVAALLGGLAALACHARRGVWMRTLIPLCAAVAVVPPYLHALAWMPFFSASGRRIHGAAAWTASGWVIVAASLPLCFIFASVQLAALQPVLLTAASVWVRDVIVIRRVALPLLRPALAAAASLVYLAALSDFAVPSLFSADPWALAVFSEFSATHSAGLAALHSLPIILAATPAAILLARWIRNIEPRPRHSDGGPARAFCLHPWLVAGFLLLSISLGGLAVSLVWQSAAGEPVGSAVRIQETARSISYAVLGTLLATAAGAPFGHLIASSRRVAIWLFAALPLALPAPLTGIGLIQIWNQPWGKFVYATPWMVALASAARFAPAAALLTGVYLKSLDRQILDAASLYSTPFRAFKYVKMWMFAPGWAGAAMLCFALSLGEVSATLPVAPPGATTIAVRLYNYLHYGASASVASLALILGVAAAGAGLCLSALLRRRQAP